MSFSIEWIENDAIVSLSDEVNFSEIDSANGLLYGDARFENMKFQIFEFENASKINLKAKDFAALGVLDKNSSIWNKKMKVAIVLQDDEMIRLMDIYKNIMKDTEWEIEVFNNLDEAKYWCNK